MKDNGFHALHPMTQVQYDTLTSTCGGIVQYCGGLLAPVKGRSGREFVWTGYSYPPSARVYSYATLSLAKGSNSVLLVVNAGVHVLNIPPGNVGIWYVESGTMKVLCFDPEGLAEFRVADVADRFGFFSRPYIPYHSEGDPLYSIAFGTDLAPGRHSLSIPSGLQTADELLLPEQSEEQVRSMLYWSEPDTPLYNVYSVVPRRQEVVVYPQRWFTARNLDDGRNNNPHIMRILRDPESLRMIGDGVRLGPFELTEDGCYIGHWLKPPAGSRVWGFSGPAVWGFQFRSRFPD